MFEYGDPYVEWQEENSSREDYEGDDAMTIDELKAEVAKILVVKYDYLENVADSSVEESVKNDPDNWHENSDPESLAEAIADDDDE